MKRFLALVLTAIMSITLLTACGGGEKSPTKPSAGKDETTGKTETPKKDVTLSMMVSQGWLEEKDDLLFEKFTEDTGIEIDVQVAPADQYPDLLMSRLNSGNVTDIYWIQTDPFAIKTTLIEPEKYCMDFTGEEWVKAMVPARLSSLEYDGKMYGMMRRPNSPEFTLLYNKTLFKELGIEEVPTTYAEFKDIAATVHAAGIIPW
ncbi:MAG TPA: carbohydrate ABC transporter substrate-binding protein, partial [Epulopiscium sp.]|nr:carbohydrate ABC transporter substrate-binding protein [Candidatus Epulonipiscium sp.]